MLETCWSCQDPTNEPHSTMIVDKLSELQGNGQQQKKVDDTAVMQQEEPNRELEGSLEI